MSEPPSPIVEQAPAIRLAQYIERGKQLLLAPPVSQARARGLVMQIRSELRKLYGTDSDVANHWPLIASNATQPVACMHLQDRIERVSELLRSLEAAAKRLVAPVRGHRVFIGHGRSPVWREFKDFLHDRLSLLWEEFNSEPTAGMATTERLHHMVQNCTFAFLLMTAEDQHADMKQYARLNVVHEIGLFQGALGVRRAIVLVEEGCEQFSNIYGLTHIPFSRGRVSSSFEEVRRVLEREGITSPGGTPVPSQVRL